MANSELVSRSLLLLQYLLAVDMTRGNHADFENHPDVAEVRSPAADPECVA
jgi:hypothetical protein